MENSANQIYVIKKIGRGYWCIGDRGYSHNLNLAKKFSKEEAEEIVNRPSSDKTMHSFHQDLKK